MTQRDKMGRRFVGYAKDEAGQVNNNGGQRAVIRNQMTDKKMNVEH